MIIFITGKSGSGKSTFAKELALQLNYTYVDVDKIAHTIYEDKSLIEDLSKLFNANLYNEDNVFDRKKLGTLLFSEKDKTKIENFNNLTWNHIKPKLTPYLKSNVILDWLMLPMTELWNLDSIKILIRSINEEDRINKILERDKITKEYLTLRESGTPRFIQSQFNFIITHDYTKNFKNQAIVIANTIKNMKGENI